MCQPFPAGKTHLPWRHLFPVALTAFLHKLPEPSWEGCDGDTPFGTECFLVAVSIAALRGPAQSTCACGRLDIDATL